MCLSRLRVLSRIFSDFSSVLPVYARRIAGGMVSGIPEAVGAGSSMSFVCELLDGWLSGPGADDGRGVPHQGMGTHRRAQSRQLGRVVASEHLPRGSGFGVLLPRSVLEPQPGVGHRLGHDNALLVAPGLVGLPQQGHQDSEALRRAEHVDSDACHRCGVRVIAAEPAGEGLTDLVVV
jgi:hypothetical protein